LERFYEFALRVMCMARGMSTKMFADIFRSMVNQSERQLGAFMLLYAIEFDEQHEPEQKWTTFRNSVIHKGKIPTLEETEGYASYVYSTILRLYLKIHAKHADHVQNVIMQSIQEKHAKIQNNNNMMSATNIGPIFFNIASDIEPDFSKALNGFKKARRDLHDELKKLLSNSLRARSYSED